MCDKFSIIFHLKRGTIYYIEKSTSEYGARVFCVPIRIGFIMKCHKNSFSTPLIIDILWQKHTHIQSKNNNPVPFDTNKKIIKRNVFCVNFQFLLLNEEILPIIIKRERNELLVYKLPNCRFHILF